MESEEATQPSIGFPLALALLLVFLCFMSGLFLSCLHWNKLRALLGASSTHDQDSHIQDDIEYALHKSAPARQELENEGKSLPVLMPGDDTPKFIAIPCPCQPPIVQKSSLKLQKPLS
ncbi:uncharacterized protein At5g65660 [Ricinus communis]|uniref:Hydroxyproline-rich glycoprotein n=1 Tax=Ricinus communis TaxID=3988 RepID=B9SMW9_RICCO|nr:uncharacterized protein At5g65660 [Ricinus communis]EEF35010.1 conserved hypothetical protein [Ricinus communis]|eukprot:XP_002527338.1 uncharacterized protein At5g65660 [Ricinus communis]